MPINKRFLGNPNTSISQWLKRPTYSITIDFDMAKGHVIAPTSARRLEVVELKAIPNAGYLFVKWSDGNEDPNRTITVTSNISLTAIFEYASYVSLALVDGTRKKIGYADSELTLFKISAVDVSVNTNTLQKIIEIPNNVTSIGADAFSGCANLQSIEIPDSVTSIGEFAFSNCSNLQSIEIPDSVTSIGKFAFNQCIELTRITLSKGINTIQYSTFANCYKLTSIEIPDGVTSIGYMAFYWCTSLTSIEIPASVNSIDSWWTFGGCEKITSTSFSVSPDSTAFSVVDGLLCSKDGKTIIVGINGDITIPASITNIKPYAFSRLTKLTHVTIPSNVTEIGYSAFADCYELSQANFNGRTLQQVKAMNSYSWGLDEQIIIAEL